MDWSVSFLGGAQPSVPNFDSNDTDPQSDETCLAANDSSVFR